MKSTKPAELRELSLEDLRQRLQDQTKSLTDMRFKKAVSGQLENPARIRTTRREIARIQTIITEKTGV